jgi:hypothetical protein
LPFLLETHAFFGLDAPIISWLAALGIALAALYFGSRLMLRTYTIRRKFAKLSKSVAKISRDTPLGPGSGLPIDAFDRLRELLDKSPLMADAWRTHCSKRVLRRTGERDEEVWFTAPAVSTFSDGLFDLVLNRGFYSALPGVLTGVGLMFTFIAILIALLHVHLTDNKVQGLDLLIGGLSGKFVSSIVALAAATFLILIEKPILRGLGLCLHEFQVELDRFLPTLSEAQLLADLGRDIGEQSVAFRAFNADLSQRLRQSFTESMGPTLTRMVSVIEDLSTLLRAAEAQKQDSITGSLEHLLARLETSLTRTFDEMGNRFRESISGSAMTEFQRVGESLAGTAKLLESMNGQFHGTQAMLNEIVQLANKTTTEQLDMGKQQVEGLTQVLRGLMTELQERTGSSMDSMSATLTAVVHELTGKVTALSEQMSANMAQSSNAATSAASHVLQTAESWSERSAAQLANLLERYESHLGSAQELRRLLDDSLGGFMNALGQYRSVSQDVQQLTVEFHGAVTGVAGVVKGMRDTQDSVQQVLSLTARQIEALSVANGDQRQLWEGINASMDHYRQLFTKVDEDAASLLRQIAQHLRDYIETSQKGFDGLVEASNEHFANATQKLAGSVDELDEALQTLTETLAPAQQARLGA